ncbi:MAG: Gfo/Idh/MocA family oxidoreductase, partial [Candidatus Omnitrophica bacterium]|nr:Gfo/Idh/MocA family oxidoreductase [Candidatus Omnitrophota bacterium]
MRELKVNIIGTGIMGTAAANTLSRNPKAKLTAIADKTEDRRKQAEKEFELEKSYSDYEEMLDNEKPDVAFIATPDWFHFEPIMACLNRG